MLSKMYLAWVVGFVGVAIALASCAPIDDGAVASEPSALFSNGGFESGAPGTAPPGGWAVLHFLSPGITVQTPQTLAGLNLMAGGVANTVILGSAAGPNTQVDLALGAAASLRWPRYGNQCVIVNGPNTSALNTTGAGANVNELMQTMTVGGGDVDPSDGQIHIRFAMAPVLQNPAHTAAQQPYYFIQVTNLTRGLTLYSDFNLSAGAPWTSVVVGGVQIDYTDWTLVDVAPGSSAIGIGDQVQVQIIASGCSQGAHWGEVYVDGLGATIPGISVEATGPAQANSGTNITYSLVYRNGSPPSACTTSANCSPTTEACVGGFCAETNVVIDFTTPPGTNFQSLVPPAGASCVVPAVGAAGNIVCTFTGPVPAGASGMFTITVQIGAASNPIIAGLYDIHSTQEPPLRGPTVRTRLDCALDADCLAGNWCFETTRHCTPQLTNGTPMPNDPPHSGPTLNRICTAAAGALVCVSGVCDPDNACGYRNGDGPCSASTACRSAICDADNQCGRATGNGPCTLANANVVCRSGACSVTGVCEARGGCYVDADCAGGNWCNEAMHACTAVLANGMMVPTDPAHAGPTLNGTCTPAVGALVCASGVCDVIDNRCGLANGDGPCATTPSVCRARVCDPDGRCALAIGDGPCLPGDGPVLCRSGSCSVTGTCDPLGGCNVDADCTGGTWCSESTHACVPQLTNGMVLPVDGPHASPTLDGTCSAAAAALVCASGVCDATDNRCGYANGDGPCTAVSGTSVCRSAICAAIGPRAGLCVVCADDTACASATPVCDVAMGACVQCTPTRTAACVGHTPVCASSETCVACDADFGSSAASACPSSSSPFCTSLGACDRCTADADCRSGSHPGPICNATTGVCGTQCAVDADCDAGSWCNDVGMPGTGTCHVKLPNGDALPGGTCTAGLGTRACVSAICASAGPNAGHCAQCTTDAQCGGATPACDAATNTCVAAMIDAGTVVVPDGGARDAAAARDGAATRDAGSSDAGASGMDAGVAPASAGGCSCRATGSGGGSSGWLGILLAAAAIGWRRARRTSRFREPIPTEPIPRHDSDPG